MAALATLDEFEARLGSLLSGAEKGRASAALDDASAIVRGATGKDFTSGAPDGVRAVVLRVARRLYMNPDGLMLEMLGAASNQRPTGDAGALLTSAEERMLKAVLGSGFTPLSLHTPASNEGGGDAL